MHKNHNENLADWIDTLENLILFDKENASEVAKNALSISKIEGY